MPRSASTSRTLSQPALDEVPTLRLFSFVRRLKCCLSWALLSLMFAMALVPASGLTVFHAHDDHADSSEHQQGLLALSHTYHANGAHQSEGLHAHRIGWQQVQKSSGVREMGAPVLVADVWVQVLASITPANFSVKRAARLC